MKYLISTVTLAAVSMLMATLCFTLVNISAQYLLRYFDWSQVLWLRGVIGFLLLALGYCVFSIKPVQITKNTLLYIVVRAILELAMFGFFIVALKTLALSFAASIAMLGPPLVVCFASLVLKEALLPHRIIAAIVSFFAALLIINPASPSANLESLFYVGLSVLCFVANALLARKYGNRVSALTLTLYSHAVMIVVLLPFLFESWVPINLQVTVLPLAILSIASLVGVFLFSVAYAIGKSSFVSTFYYSEILWALLLDFMLFQLVPPVLSMVGVAIMISAGVISANMESSRDARGKKDEPMSSQQNNESTTTVIF